MLCPPSSSELGTTDGFFSWGGRFGGLRWETGAVSDDDSSGTSKGLPMRTTCSAANTVRAREHAYSVERVQVCMQGATSLPTLLHSYGSHTHTHSLARTSQQWKIMCTVVSRHTILLWCGVVSGGVPRGYM